jgi:hypothetical protein
MTLPYTPPEIDALIAEQAAQVHRPISDPLISAIYTAMLDVSGMEHYAGDEINQAAKAAADTLREFEKEKNE